MAPAVIHEAACVKPSTLLSLLACLSLPLAGCMFGRLERDLAQKGEYGTLTGTVRTPQPTDEPIIVVVTRGEDGAEQVLQEFVLAGPGPYFFTVPAGSYRIAAFRDRNRNFAYDPRIDPAAQFGGGEAIDVPAGATRGDLDIEILDAGGEPLPFALTSADREASGERSLSDFHLGEVTAIDDPRFSEENARLGLWQPAEFLRRVGAGVYFLEPYDARKTPVLFVHGAVGHPGNFTHLIARLDRERFQPWVVFYPTAVRLDQTAMSLDRWVQALYVTHRYQRMAVVAHSMGGLVARAFVNRVVAAGDGRADGLRLFLSMSTPWDGHSAAQSGVERAPVVVPSWYDMAPGSPFLESLLEQPLPPSLPYDLLFSFAGRSRLVRGANDGAVTIASQLDMRAQEQSRVVRGFDESHGSILRSDDVAAFLNQRLASDVDEAPASSRGRDR